MQSNDKTSFDKDLDKLASGYARLQNDEPPALLDQAILNNARRAVEKQSHWSQFGWLHGITTAAVFVLALSLILNQREGPSLEETEFIVAPKPELEEPRMAVPGKARQALDEHEPKLERSAGDDARQDTASKTIPEGEIEAAHELPPPATFSALPTSAGTVVELDREDADAVTGEAEKRVQEIIRMKNAGDPEWKNELARFRDDFPEYPVPKELEE